MQDLSDKTVVVTGAGSGIGRATALAFASEGANIVAVDLYAERAEATAKSVAALGRKGVPVACDVGRKEDLAKVRANALDQLGRIDILMNNVGFVVTGAFLDIGIEYWRKTFEINLFAAVQAVQLMLPDILRQGEGHIINVASTAALYPYNTDRMPYNASKLALASFSEALAMELHPKNIGVTLLCPGPVKTNIIEHIVSLTPNLPMIGPELPVKEAEELGDMVIAAVRNRTFFLPSNAEVHAIYAEHGANPDRFLAAATERFEERRNRSEGTVIS
jgi:NAD(P)-dependent dehydrogenase (short-subunit alcohol dehydrogenase family)